MTVKSRTLKKRNASQGGSNQTHCQILTLPTALEQGTKAKMRNSHLFLAALSLFSCVATWGSDLPCYIPLPESKTIPQGEATQEAFEKDILLLQRQMFENNLTGTYVIRDADNGYSIQITLASQVTLIDEIPNRLATTYSYDLTESSPYATEHWAIPALKVAGISEGLSLELEEECDTFTKLIAQGDSKHLTQATLSKTGELALEWNYPTGTHVSQTLKNAAISKAVFKVLKTRKAEGALPKLVLEEKN
jgi:hypothetical protein